MPGGDGTGPRGTGGRCTPLWMSGQVGRPRGCGLRSGGRAVGTGRGMGMGGCGRGFRNMFYMTGQAGWMRQGLYKALPEPSRGEELRYLEQESRILSEQLGGIKERLERLRK